MSQPLLTAAALTRQLLFNGLSSSVQRILRSQQIEIADGKIWIWCTTRHGAAMIRNSTYSELLYSVAGSTTLQLDYVQYAWGNDRSHAYELPLFFAEIQGLTWTRLDLSSVPVWTDREILDEIVGHEIANRLPACCFDMASDRPIFVSDNIYLLGISKSELLATRSVADCFSDRKLADFKIAIIQGKGQDVEVSCQSANLGGNPQRWEWQTRSRLVRTSWGRLARIVKILALPKPLASCSDKEETR